MKNSLGFPLFFAGNKKTKHHLAISEGTVLGSMVSKWVISPTYKWGIPWGYNQLILTFDPSFLGHPRYVRRGGGVGCGFGPATPQVGSLWAFLTKRPQVVPAQES